MPFFSIIVPIYKAEAFLPDCVNSILGQSFCDFELILVDDGSPDGCGALCDSFAQADRRIRVFHQANQGVSAARNLGLEHASGNYVLFVDADDLLPPGALEILQNAASKISSSDFLYWDYCATAPDAFPENPVFTPVPFRDFGRLWATEYSVGFVWNKLFRRSVLEKYNIRFPAGIPYMEDSLFVVDYCRAMRQEDSNSTFVHLSLPLYLYRRCNAGSITQTHGLAYAQRQYNVVPHLIAAAQEFQCPTEQLDLMYSHYLKSVCHGIALIAASRELSFWKKRAELHRLFHCEQARQIIRYHKQNKFYSIDYLPFRLHSTLLIRLWHWAKSENESFYYGYINVYPRRFFFSKWRTV